MDEAYFANKCSIGKYTWVYFTMFAEIFVCKFAVFHEFQITIFTFEFENLFFLNAFPTFLKVGLYKVICASHQMFGRGIWGKLPEYIFKNLFDYWLIIPNQ